MALSLTAAQLQALQQNHIVRRDFIWCDALDDSGDPDPAGFWNDSGNVEHDGRIYVGSGTLFEVSGLPAQSELAIPDFQIRFSGISPEVITLVRARRLAQRPVEWLLGLYDVDNREVLTPLILRFRGRIDTVDVTTPEAGGDSVIVFTCESTSRALTIKRFDVRSQSHQQERASGDTFFRYTAGMREAPINFGEAKPREGSRKPPSAAELPKTLSETAPQLGDFTSRAPASESDDGGGGFRDLDLDDVGTSTGGQTSHRRFGRPGSGR